MNSTRESPILVFRIGQLGDTIISVPALVALRRQSPGRRMILLTDHHPRRPELVSSWSIVGALGLCDEVMRYDVSDRVFGKARSYLDLARQIRAAAPYQVVNLAPRTRTREAWRDRLFFRAICGVPRYVAPPPTSTVYPAREEAMPEWLRLLRAIEPSASADAMPEIRLPAEAEEEARAAMTPVATTSRPIAFAPGSKMPAKRWPIEKFKRAAKGILETDPLSAIVVLGGPEDEPLGEELRHACAGRALNLCGRLSPLGSAAVLERCAAFIGNDTGTMHLAGLVGTPCVALFSARDQPGKWVPLGKGHLMLRKQVDCAGCMLEVCDKGNLCLDMIAVEEVVAAWKRLAF